MRAIFFSCLFLEAMLAASANAEDLAIVVSKDSKIESVSSVELQKIFLLQTKKGVDGSTFVVLMREKNSPERVLVLSKIYRLTEAGLDAYFLRALYTGECEAAPRVVPSAEIMKRVVAKTLGAIGYIYASETDDTIKILKVNDRAPGAADYPLRVADK